MTNNIQSKLQSWKCNHLNMASILVLEKSSLESIANYWFSLHKIPKTVIKKIDGIKRSFFWRNILNQDTTKKKMHTISWEIIFSGKDNGGLNLTKVEQKNLLLLSKWWWKFHNDKN